MNFITALGTMMLLVGMVFGVLYWIRFLFKKIAPNFRWWIKYKIFRRKHKQEDVERLIECLEREMNDVDVIKFFLINNVKKKKIAELVYIYQEMKKLKGGESK